MKSLIHPYGRLTGGTWLKGNLHTHTTRSDGYGDPQSIIDEYARRGYGFLALTDHDKLTTETDYRAWDARGMILIPGAELGGGAHLVQVDGSRLPVIHPSRQVVLNDILAIRSETGRGFAIAAHPNWGAAFDHATIAQLREWTGYTGMEIYNSSIIWDDGSPYALAKWDMLLAGGHRTWGFANDDCHHPAGVGLGWNTAYVHDSSVQGVCEALYAGRFYCSTGVVIRAIHVTAMTICIEAEDAYRINAIRDVGRCIAMAEGDHLEVDVPEDARYVRFECWGKGETCAWTQPFFVPGHGDRKDGGNSLDNTFLRQWRISHLLRQGRLPEATFDEGVRLATQPAVCHPAGHVIDGLVDVRETVQSNGGVVYLMTEFHADRTGQGVLKLGYDGPIRVWMDGIEVFFGPGTNPAVPDQTRLYVPLRRGANRLVIALDSNHGKAWGIFGRLELIN